MTENYDNLIEKFNTQINLSFLKSDKYIVELIIALDDWNKNKTTQCSKYTSTINWLGLSTIYLKNDPVDCFDNIINLLLNLLPLQIDADLTPEPWLKETPTLFHILSKAQKTPIKITTFLLNRIINNNDVKQIEGILGLLRKFLIENKEDFLGKLKFTGWINNNTKIRFAISDLILQKNVDGKTAIDMAEGDFKDFLIYITKNIPLRAVPASTTPLEGGKARQNKKVKTDKRVKVDGRMRVVYRGVRGAEYIKNKDVYVRI